MNSEINRLNKFHPANWKYVGIDSGIYCDWRRYESELGIFRVSFNFKA